MVDGLLVGEAEGSPARLLGLSAAGTGTVCLAPSFDLGGELGE